MTHLVFEEKQRFNQPWLWVIIIGVSLLLFIKIPLDLIHSSAEDQPLDLSSSLIIIFSFLFIVALNVLFYSAKLNTKIDGNGIGITFWPFINKPKVFNWDDIKNAYVRKYKPLSEFGGWGIRYGWNGRAYNTSGNMGLQIILKSGKKILIGTQKPNEIETYFKNNNFLKE